MYGFYASAVLGVYSLQLLFRPETNGTYGKYEVKNWSKADFIFQHC